MNLNELEKLSSFLCFSLLIHGTNAALRKVEVLYTLNPLHIKKSLFSHSTLLAFFLPVQNPIL